MCRLVAVVAVLCGACATPRVVDERQFTVTSTPPGAKIEERGLFVGETPLTISLPCETLTYAAYTTTGANVVVLTATPPPGTVGDVQQKVIHPCDGPGRIDFTMTLKQVKPVERIETVKEHE